MNEVFLGIIAGAVLVMALIQVGVILMAARAARRVERLAGSLEQDLRPVIANLQTLTAEAARATALAAGQVERADRLLEDLAGRIEDTAATLQASILAPIREGMAVLKGLRAVLGAFRGFRDGGGPRRRPAGPTPVDDDDALFIG